MKKWMLTLLIIISNNVFSQEVFTNPDVGTQNHKTTTINISKIERYNNKTVIHFVCKNENREGWISIDPNTFIRKSGGTKAYTLIEAVGIPLSPEKKEFDSVGQKVSFKLVFPKIAKNIRKIDIVECGKSNCFNFYEVHLANGEKEKFELKKINISTNFRTMGRWDKKANEFNVISKKEEVTFFEFNKEMTILKHTTPSITSAYVVKRAEKNKNEKQWEFSIVSDVGKRYFVILDIEEDNLVFFYKKDKTSYAIVYKIKKVWTEK